MPRLTDCQLQNDMGIRTKASAK